MLLGKGGGPLPGLGCTLLQRSGTDALPTGGPRTRDVSENGVANSNLLFVKHLESHCDCKYNAVFVFSPPLSFTSLFSSVLCLSD